jgi:hypothetical protein
MDVAVVFVGMRRVEGDAADGLSHLLGRGVLRRARQGGDAVRKLFGAGFQVLGEVVEHLGAVMRVR